MPRLATKATSSILGKFEIKVNRLRVVRAGKGFTLFIFEWRYGDIVKIVESPEKLGLLVSGATETVKHKINKEEGELLVAMIAPMAASLIAPGASSLILLIASFINAITEKKNKKVYFFDYYPCFWW